MPSAPLHSVTSTYSGEDSLVDMPSAPLHTVTSTYSREESLDISSKTSKIHAEFPGKSCAKILLANVYLKNDSNTQMRMYVMLDDQSNRSLASPHLFDSLGVEGQKINYTLTSCSGKKRAVGRRALNIVVESLDHSAQLQLCCY
jgi:hypothetical protein